MSCAQHLKRMFHIHVETCPACGGAVRITACIENTEVIEKILTHLDAKGGAASVVAGLPAGAAGKSAPAHG